MFYPCMPSLRLRFLPILDQLLSGWRTQSYRLGAMRALAGEISPDTLPQHEVTYGTMPGRTGTLLVQSPGTLLL